MIGGMQQILPKLTGQTRHLKGVKMYTKGESVLRIEATAHNTKGLNCPRGLFNLPFIVTQLGDIVDRFLTHLHCSDISLIDNNTLEELSQPGVLGKMRLGGLDLNKPRIQSVFKGIIQLGICPNGFKISDLAQRVDRMLPGITYTVRMAAYDLRKLRSAVLAPSLFKIPVLCLMVCNSAPSAALPIRFTPGINDFATLRYNSAIFSARKGIKGHSHQVPYHLKR